MGDITLIGNPAKQLNNGKKNRSGVPAPILP